MRIDFIFSFMQVSRLGGEGGENAAQAPASSLCMLADPSLKRRFRVA
jgi:hypothetical protein